MPVTNVKMFLMFVAAEYTARANISIWHFA